jgi:sodium-dependent dicarboxylate transporter 2/3/5
VPIPDAATPHRNRVRLGGFLVGLAGFAAMLGVPAPTALGESGWHVAACALLMAVWWLSEALPVAATALLPLILFPALGVRDLGATAAAFGNPLLFLFLGGFLIALGIERSGLHERIAILVLRGARGRPALLVLGFLSIASFISLWVSNTATAAMLLPVGVSTLAALGGATGETGERAARNLRPALMLSIAYGTTIGGVGTLIGTPPNALFAAFMRDSFGREVSFLDWMAVGLPIVVLMVPLVWIWLTLIAFPVRGLDAARIAASIAARRQALPPLDQPAILTGLVFLATGLGSAPLLDWSATKRLPWGTLILFGGGLALADAVEASRLAGWLAGGIASLGHFPPIVLVLIVAAIIIGLSELASNTAVAAIFLPLVSAAALGLGADPAALGAPAVLAASLAFMLPVGTPPNAIVFGSGHVTIGQMARTGAVLNLIGLAVIMLVGYPLALLVFGR